MQDQEHFWKADCDVHGSRIGAIIQPAQFVHLPVEDLVQDRCHPPARSACRGAEVILKRKLFVNNIPEFDLTTLN